MQNVSHENDLIFMRMNAQVIYIFIPIVLHKDAFYHRGKSKLGIEVFIHELLREPLIVWAVIASRRTLTRKHRFHCNPTKNPTDNDNLIVCTLYHVYQCTNLHLESRNASQCFSLLLLPFLLQFFLFSSSSSVLQFFFLYISQNSIIARFTAFEWNKLHQILMMVSISPKRLTNAFWSFFFSLFLFFH